MDKPQVGQSPEGAGASSGNPEEPAERPRRGAFLKSRLGMTVLALLLIGSTALLAFLSLSPQKRRRVAKKAKGRVSQAVATVYEGDLSNLPGFERIGRRLGLVTGPMPAAISAAPEKKKSSADPETAKIQRQMDELMESIEGFTGTSAAGRPLLQRGGAKPQVRPETGRFGPGRAQPASQGMGPHAAGAVPAGASRRRLGAGATSLRGGAGMSGGFARQFDSARFQDKPSAPAAQDQDPSARAGPRFSRAFQQADSLKGSAIPAAPSTPAQEPVQEQAPAGGLISKTSRIVDDWLVKLGLGESVLVRFLRKVTGSSPRRPAPAAPGRAGPER